MNALTAQLRHNSINSSLVYSLFMGTGVKVEECPSLSPYELEACMTLIAHGTGMKIRRIAPRYRLGRVLSIDVTPYSSGDPTLAFCSAIDLSVYYRFWNKAISQEEEFPWGWRKKKIMKEYREVVDISIRASETLTDPERLFLLIEIMKLENELLLT